MRAIVMAQSATEKQAFFAIVVLAYDCSCALSQSCGLSKSFSGVGLPTNASFYIGHWTCQPMYAFLCVDLHVTGEHHFACAV
jgi:hypothetical protein